MDKDFSNLLEKNRSTVILVSILIVCGLSLMFVSGAWSAEELDTLTVDINSDTQTELGSAPPGTLTFQVSSNKLSNENSFEVRNNLDEKIKLSGSGDNGITFAGDSDKDSIIVDSGSTFSGNLNVDNPDDDIHISYTVVE